jgi:hypothetical protein
MTNSSDLPTCLERPRALGAAEAGVYLAQLLGLATPISAAQMWRYAREGIIPVVRLGRRVWFQSAALHAFITSGGAASVSARGDIHV